MKSKLSGAVILALACVAAAGGTARAQIEEVVVTAERSYEAPDIYIVKRADHLISSVTITCDTRDAEKRHEEMRATLREMIAEAKRSETISLGLGEPVLGELKESNFDEIITSDSRTDTSTATVIVKTSVSKTDTIDSATTRIKEFIAKAPKIGRSEMKRESRWDLTIIGPEQYHNELVGMIADQSKKTADKFGAGYGVSIDGLEHSVSWVQKGPLDLALYIPYSLHVAPLGAH
jgi:hypothetical protein